MGQYNEYFKQYIIMYTDFNKCFNFGCIKIMPLKIVYGIY